MKRNILLVFTIFIYSINTACVSNTKYDSAVAENQRLKLEIEELKYGANVLISDGKQFFEAKDYKKAKEKLNTLFEKHPNSPETIEGKKIFNSIKEEELWENAITTNKLSYVEDYIEKFPDGKYITSAFSKEKYLKKELEKDDYENAINKNTSTVWKSFIDKYPNHKEAVSIEEKIIRLEVDEILKDSKTGTMPSLESFGRNQTTRSSIEITNRTGCNLTIRYSGSEVRKIEIPSGGRRTLYFPSGNYKVAASACGSNYAGREILNGDYTSEFYISTTRRGYY